MGIIGVLVNLAADHQDVGIRGSISRAHPHARVGGQDGARLARERETEQELDLTDDAHMLDRPARRRHNDATGVFVSQLAGIVDREVLPYVTLRAAGSAASSIPP